MHRAGEGTNLHSNRVPGSESPAQHVISGQHEKEHPLPTYAVSTMELGWDREDQPKDEKIVRDTLPASVVVIADVSRSEQRIDSHKCDLMHSSERHI